MIQAFFYNPQANIAASPITDRFSNQDQLGLLSFDASIPLIEDEWKGEEYAYGEHYDKIDSKLSIHAVKLHRQLLGCRDPC